MIIVTSKLAVEIKYFFFMDYKTEASSVSTHFHQWRLVHKISPSCRKTEYQPPRGLIAMAMSRQSSAIPQAMPYFSAPLVFREPLNKVPTSETIMPLYSKRSPSHGSNELFRGRIP